MGFFLYVFNADQPCLALRPAATSALQLRLQALGIGIPSQQLLPCIDGSYLERFEKLNYTPDWYYSKNVHADE